MILKRLTLENFRQFMGRHELIFASATPQSSANITVVYGENGRGKTGIFRALMFCLYGDRRLSQDEEVSKEELSLVNLHVLRDGSRGSPVASSVEAEFTHAGERYILRRTLRAVLHGSSVHEEVPDVVLSIQDSAGNSRSVTDPDSVRDAMARVLDPRVREYFLFDGERIERLTRASAEQRREVAQGIRNLLNIDDLETAIAAAKGLCRALDTEIRAKSTGDHAKVIKQINELEDRLAATRRRLHDLEDETSAARAELHKVDKELEAYQEISELLHGRQALTARLQELAEQMTVMLSQMRGRSARAAVSMVEPALKQVFELIDAKKRRGELPPEIRHELIAKILGDGRCICGRSIADDADARSHILAWKERSEDPGVSDAALDLWRYLHTLTSRLEDERQATEAMLQRYAEMRHEENDIQHRLEQIKEQIGATERNDAAQLEKHRQKIEADVIRLEAERQNLSSAAEQLTEDMEALRLRRSQLENEMGLRDELVRRSRMATQVHTALSGVHDAFCREIVERISQAATEVFRCLLDAEGQRNLRGIVVKDDYSIQMLDRWNTPFLANISAGQRQIMSISFILALARTAAGGGTLEMPLFMDTPFGRLSYDHRVNLIRQLPSWATQWVLLATNTELSRDEGELLVAEGRLGRFYSLRAGEDGTTSIEERSIEDALPLLRNRRRIAHEHG